MWAYIRKNGMDSGNVKIRDITGIYEVFIIRYSIFILYLRPKLLKYQL
jgi:hypothetical protein